VIKVFSSKVEFHKICVVDYIMLGRNIVNLNPNSKPGVGKLFIIMNCMNYAFDYRW